MRSSYSENGYDKVFTALVEGFKPRLIVELGVLDGYSLIAMAEGLKRNSEHGHGVGFLDAYDLFSDYPYKHGNKEEIEKMVSDLELGNYVKLSWGDAYAVDHKYSNNSINMLHVDISNTGDTIHKIMELWDSKIDTGGMVIFEGGTDERDAVDWMKKYNMPSIKKAIESDKILNTKYVYATYLKFPGLTTCLKKRA